MLQLQAKNIDISRISKLLVKYNVKASMSNLTIILDGNISEALLTELCMEIEIHSVQNYISEEQMNISEENSLYKSETIVKIPEQTSFSDSEEDTHVESMEEPIRDLPRTNTLSHNTPEYNLIYSVVKRGEVYWCDFGQPYGHEQGGKRPVIIVQNNSGNTSSPTTIVLGCTTAQKKELPVHYNLKFSSETFVDYDIKKCGEEENVILAEQIITIDKTRLRDYIGTLTPEIMEKIQEIIDISLELKRETKTIVKEKTVYVDRPSSPKTIGTQEVCKGGKDVNIVQVQLLSFVDINELNKIRQTNFPDIIKAEKILELFGFDLQRNGVQHLLKAIIVSPKDAYFNLEILTEKVSKQDGISKEEIMRLIVARVKERFSFKKAPTIDFIRLVNTFLLKQEDTDE